MTNEAGSADAAAEAQTGDETPDAGTPQKQSEDTTLKSRVAGLDAKVTSLIQQAKDAETRAAEAAQKLADYEAGKVGADEALRAQLEAKERELAQERQERAVEKLQSAYPETFAVFGAAAASFSPDQLAASEARFQGVSAEEPENPAPVGTNPARKAPSSPIAIEDMTREQLDKYLRGMDPSVMFRGS